MYYKDSSGNIIAEVINDYLPEGLPEELEEHFLNRNPLWRFQPSVTKQKNDKDCFWAFVIWRQPEGVLAPEFDLLAPITERLNYKGLLRIKANMYPSTENLIYHKPHQDYTFNNKSGIYYVNSNNGYTQIGDHKIESIKNRFVVFDGSRYHNSTNCTDSQVRVTINFNWL